jgi:hypothetical protein
MPPPDEGVSLGELSRRLTDVFTRFEGLARRLEDGQFVSTQLYQQYKENVNQALAALERRVNDIENGKVSKNTFDPIAAQVKSLDTDKIDKSVFDSLVSRVAQLEDDKKWLVRLVLGFIVLGILGAIFVASGGASK